MLLVRYVKNNWRKRSMLKKQLTKLEERQIQGSIDHTRRWIEFVKYIHSKGGYVPLIVIKLAEDYLKEAEELLL
jgi:hypothetical protein